jgi:hypothetical protein
MIVFFIGTPRGIFNSPTVLFTGAIIESTPDSEKLIVQRSEGYMFIKVYSIYQNEVSFMFCLEKNSPTGIYKSIG